MRSWSRHKAANGHTNRSSAVGAVVGDCLFSIDMASDRMFCKLARVVSAGSRNGFRDTGRGGGSSKGEDRAGDTARLRKGLFEERLSDKPADCWSKIPEKVGVSKRSGEKE